MEYCAGLFIEEDRQLFSVEWAFIEELLNV